VTNVDARTRAIVAKLLVNDPSVAADLRDLGNQLFALAERIEARQDEAMKSTGGTGDRVQMNLVSPDGTVKSTHDTGASP
jgi:hypothetical protein